MLAVRGRPLSILGLELISNHLVIASIPLLNSGLRSVFLMLDRYFSFESSVIGRTKVKQALLLKKSRMP